MAVFGVSIVFTALLLTFINVNRSSSQTVANNCSGILITNANQTGGTTPTIVTGLATFNITIPTLIQATEVTMYAVNTTTNTETTVGRAQPQPTSTSTTGTSTSTWNFRWDTTLWPATTTTENIKLIAQINYNGGTTSCKATSTSAYRIYSSPSYLSSLSITANPKAYEGTVGTDNAQVIDVIGTIIKHASTTTNSEVPNLYGIFKWSTANNIGYISPKSSNFLSSNGIVYKPGTVPGTNVITATIYYGGASSTTTIQTTVRAAVTTTVNSDPGSIATSTTKPATTTTDTNTTTTNSTATPATTSELGTTTQITSSQIQISETSKSCIQDAITKTRFDAINSGTSRPTAEELTKIANCFATSKYILPSNFSPIDPLKINSLAIQSTASVNKPENVTKKDDSGDRQTLKITGKAKPKSIVVVYVYSDPLVITTSTDSDGNWQYTLEDPLEPGTHEVYAVVDKGDGTYERSNPMSFFISTVGASAVNPKGLSLTLGEMPTATPSQSKNSLIYYVAGSAVVIIVALAGLYATVILRKRHLAEATVTNNEPSQVNIGDKTKEIDIPIEQHDSIDDSAQPKPDNLGVDSDTNDISKDGITEEKDEDTPLMTKATEGLSESYPDEFQQDELNNRVYNYTDTDADARELSNIQLTDTDSPAKDNDDNNNPSEQKE